MRSLSSHPVLLSTLLLQSGKHVVAAPSPKPSAECAPAASTSFDYVIVGGGSAGLVLANRLSENADIHVAVIEAGTSSKDVAGNLTQVPGYAGALFQSAEELDLDWGFQTTPQKVRKGLTLKGVIDSDY
jgi:choline dehydrogenase